MIIGNGIDIIDINRIRRVIDKYGNRFKKRCFSISEIERSEKRLNSVESFAKRYAAKEACAKALGTGLARGVFWKDIEVRDANHLQNIIAALRMEKEVSSLERLKG